MFTTEERTGIRAALIDFASRDPRLSAAALTGSAAEDREDRWSDIDLAFAVADAADLAHVLADFTAQVYAQHHALHHVDVHAGAWIYRVFLLANTLQVDLAFVPAADFRALAPTFRLLYGSSNPPRHLAPPSAESLVGLAWLHALHARSAIARSKFWQAEYMISGLRDHVLALACLRHDLSTAHARGIDQLPSAVTVQFAGSLVRQLDGAELSRAFDCALTGLLQEIDEADSGLARRLKPAIASLSQPSCAS